MRRGSAEVCVTAGQNFGEREARDAVGSTAVCTTRSIGGTQHASSYLFSLTKTAVVLFVFAHKDRRRQSCDRGGSYFGIKSGSPGPDVTGALLDRMQMQMHPLQACSGERHRLMRRVKDHQYIRIGTVVAADGIECQYGYAGYLVVS